MTTTTVVTETRSDFIKVWNRGPITSVFTPAPSCKETMRLVTQDSSSYLYFGHAYNPFFQPGCAPTGTVSEALFSDPARWDRYYYSPAICPQSWTPAATFTSIWSGVNADTVVALGAETTAVLCCPSGYGQGQWANACASTIRQDTSITYFIPYSRSGAWYPGSVTVGSFAKGNVVQGDGVPIWYQSTDNKVLAAATQTSSEVATVSQTTLPGSAQTLSSTPPPTSSPAIPPSEPYSSNSGMSTGAKVGLGVGIPVAIILGLLLGWLCFRRRKAKAMPPPQNDMSEREYFSHEYYAQHAPPKAQMAYELPDHTAQELAATKH